MTDHKIKTINVHELKKRMDSDPTLCLIDVREDEEWQEQRIPGALHLQKDTLAGKIAIHEPDLEKPIYLHCRGGVRSLTAAGYLMDLGYTNVYSVDGGIAEWAKAGYPVQE